MLKRLAFCFGVVAVLACSAPTVDTTTAQSTQKSLERVRDSLPENKRASFDGAIRDLALSGLDIQDIKERLNGKTGEQVLSEAARLLGERERKEHEQAVGEIAELQRKDAAAELAKQKLAAFKVTRSRLYRATSGFRSQPVIELSVINGTPSPVSRAYFHGVVASPGRSVPWISEDFNYQIPGGLEPGESATWKLSPNAFSAWGTTTHSDAILTVAVVKLDGPGGKTLYAVEGLDETEQHRLAELQKKFPVHSAR